jgi:MFS family permease
MPIEDHKINHDLRMSYRMGLCRCGMAGFTQDFFTPFLLLLGGTEGQIGIMVSYSNIFSSIFQAASPEAIARMRSRKKVVSLFCLLQVASLLFIIRQVFEGPVKPMAFIIPVVLFNIFGAFIVPGWMSLLSDMVRPRRWGTYFGWRNRNLGIMTIVSTIIAGLTLYAMTPINKRLGFCMIFSVALVFCVLSWLSLRALKEPHLKVSKEDHFTFFEFIRQYRTSNFVKFTMFVAAMNFCVNLAAPFFPVLMLRDLKFNYLLFAVVNTLSALTLYVTIHRWGRHADRVGNVKIIKVVSPLFCLSPLLWIINQNPVFLISVEMFSGFLWAGFNLSTSNFILDAVVPAKRSRCLAYFTLIGGIGVAAGALAGGCLIPFLPQIFRYKLLTLFLISGVLRLAVGLLMPRRIKEVRPVDGISGRKLLLSMAGIR